jgi:hypothetical protein
MTARGWTTSEVAKRMTTDDRYVETKLALDILMVVSPTKDTLKIDDATFSELATAFGVSVDYLKNIHAYWMRWPERRSAFECPEELFGTDIQLCVTDQ